MLQYFLLNSQVQFIPGLRSLFSSPQCTGIVNKGTSLILRQDSSIVNSEYQLFLLASIKFKN